MTVMTAITPGVPVTGKTVLQAAVEATSRAAAARKAAADAARALAEERAAAKQGTPAPPP
jgi:hypothetical protein